MPHDLTILPPKKKDNKAKYKHLHSHLLQPSFNAIFVAPTACGKSTTILNLLMNDNFYKGVFDKVYYFSPSVNLDLTLKAIEEDEDIIKFSEDEELSNADEILKAIVESQKEKKEEGEKVEDILIVFDDMINYLSNNSFIGSLFTKSRHFNITVWLTSQNYRSIPVKCRNNSQMILIYKLYNGQEVDKLEEEIGCNYPDFRKYYEEATKEKYHFLYLNLRDMKMYKNFTELLWSKSENY